MDQGYVCRWQRRCRSSWVAGSPSFSSQFRQQQPSPRGRLAAPALSCHDPTRPPESKSKVLRPERPPPTGTPPEKRQELLPRPGARPCQRIRVSAPIAISGSTHGPGLAIIHARRPAPRSSGQPQDPVQRQPHDPTTRPFSPKGSRQTETTAAGITSTPISGTDDRSAISP